MADIQNLVDGLINCEDKQAYQCLKQLELKAARPLLSIRSLTYL